MTLMEKEIMEQPRALVDCENVNKETMDKLVAELKATNPTHIVLAARGTSDHAGTYFKYLCEVFKGIPVSLAAPSVVTAYGGKLNLKDAVVIAVSQSGAAADALEVVKAGNACGCTTVAITNFPDSVVAKEAKFHLWCNCGLEKSVAATKTYMTSLYLLAEIVAKWSEDKGLLEMLPKIEGLVAETLKDVSYFTELAARFRFMEECFYLSRGYMYPMAMEAALKTQETCYVRARSYAVSDFHHGPFAMIRDNMPVFFFACDKATDKDVVEMIDKVKGAGAETIVISNKQEIADKGDIAIKLPDAAEGPAAIFAGAACAQMFACRLAAAKGLNPDAPRGLTKVTVTK